MDDVSVRGRTQYCWRNPKRRSERLHLKCRTWNQIGTFVLEQSTPTNLLTTSLQVDVKYTANLFGRSKLHTSSAVQTGKAAKKGIVARWLNTRSSKAFGVWVFFCCLFVWAGEGGWRKEGRKNENKIRNGNGSSLDKLHLIVSVLQQCVHLDCRQRSTTLGKSLVQVPSIVASTMICRRVLR